MPKPIRPPSQRDRGYTNILHHLTKSEEKQSTQYEKIERLLKKIMATQEEVASKLAAVGDKLDKATQEILAAIQALKDAVAAGGASSPEVDSAISRLEAGAQTLDDINPDPQSKKKNR
jgi:hypothetical protein